MEKKNTRLVILIILLSLLVVGLSGFIFYDKILTNNNNNNDSKVINNNYKVLINNKSVNEETLNNILDMIGISYFNNSSNACLTDAISSNNYSINAQEIISRYADSHNQVLKRIEDEIYNSKECGMGAADCTAISKESAQELFDMFNFNGKITDYFQESTNLKDDYIFWYGHTLNFCDKKINHNIIAENSSEDKINEYGLNIGADITITDKQEVITNIINNNSTEKIERTVIYNFKPATNGRYYLDSVKVK